VNELQDTSQQPLLMKTIFDEATRRGTLLWLKSG
jgi:hypothetical protein